MIIVIAPLVVAILFIVVTLFILKRSAARGRKDVDETRGSN